MSFVVLGFRGVCFEIFWGLSMLACRRGLLKLVGAQNVISCVQGISEGVVGSHVVSDGVRAVVSEFAVAFCKDEVRPHAARN